jgi:hypothetical protein
VVATGSELQRHGYRVLAPDLARHDGRERWAPDLLASVPARPASAIGR